MRMSQMAAAGSFAIAIILGADARIASAQFSNPIIDQVQSGGHTYDPWTDHHTINDHTTQVHASALDPYRNYVDPGSYRRVSRYVYDQYGQLFREFGYRWTSYGRPHSKLTRVRVTHYPGSNSWGPSRPSITHVQSQDIVRSGVRRYPRPSITHVHSQTSHRTPQPSVTHVQSQTTYRTAKP